MAYHQAAHPAQATGHHAVARGPFASDLFAMNGIGNVRITDWAFSSLPESPLAHQADTTVNSPFATISPSTHTVPPMQAICKASVSFLVSTRSVCPGVTGLRNLKRFTAASSAATPSLLFAETSAVADPSITPAV